MFSTNLIPAISQISLKFEVRIKQKYCMQRHAFNCFHWGFVDRHFSLEIRRTCAEKWNSKRMSVLDWLVFAACPPSVQGLPSWIWHEFLEPIACFLWCRRGEEKGKKANLPVSEAEISVQVPLWLMIQERDLCSLCPSLAEVAWL